MKRGGVCSSHTYHDELLRRLFVLQCVCAVHMHVKGCSHGWEMHVLLCVEAQADVDGLPPLFPFLFTEAGSLWSSLIQLCSREFAVPISHRCHHSHLGFIRTAGSRTPALMLTWQRFYQPSHFSSPCVLPLKLRSVLGSRHLPGQGARSSDACCSPKPVCSWKSPSTEPRTKNATAPKSKCYVSQEGSRPSHEAPTTETLD